MSTFKEPFNLIISGVGGQGNILASALVSLAATGAGFKVVVGETYGASQRGGAVMSHVRLSQKRDYGPLIPYGKADMIVGFEPLEALRVVTKYAHSGTKVIVNTEPLYPVSVVLNESTYPAVEDILAALDSMTDRVYTLNATQLAREAGDPRVQNIMMINALSLEESFPVKREQFKGTLGDFLEGAGQEQRELNRRAFEAEVALKLFTAKG